MNRSPDTPSHTPARLASGDYYMEGENLVFTAAYHLKRGYCCGSGCRHCPYGAQTEHPGPADQLPAPEAAEEG